ncbi:uncharacterized protein LOC111895625 [Lactuca sativa]|uniref:uncharacterized protein LOC111895625 n=1 Tax=Lactuca sativa TaxID=4236 RepID=UPI000CD8228B|nr:uncharacterized protein LOC111895625 [Lactuca sativa]
MLHRFIEASEKRYDETNAVIREHQNLMRDQQALLMNHQASIENIEAQLGQLTTLVNEKLSPKITEKKPQPHVMVIETKEDTIFEFLEALEVDLHQSGPKPKKSKIEEKNIAEISNPRRGDSISTTWGGSEHKFFSDVQTYSPPLPFPSQSKSPTGTGTLEVYEASEVPEYAKFLQDLLDTRLQIKKTFKVDLSEQSSKVIMEGIPRKMRDPGRLTLPCKFGNNMKTYALADSGASINLMPYSFYQKLDLPDLKATRMTIHMANHMKEDKNVPIILGRPLLNIARALVDIRKSKLTLRVGDEQMTFGVADGFKNKHSQDEVFNIDEENEFEELEKLMEEEIQSIKKETPSCLVSKESYKDFASSGEEEDTQVLEPPVAVNGKVATMELKSEEKEEKKHELIVKNKGVKRKLEEGDAKVK